MTQPPPPPFGQQPAGQNPPPPAAPGYPAPVPPKRKGPLRWVLIGAGVLILLCCIGVITKLAGGDDSASSKAGTATIAPAERTAEAEGAPATKAAETKQAEAKEITPGLKQPARDGKFEFVVSSMKCGVSEVGSDLLGAKAQGQFCLVNLSVKNIGKKAQSFADSAQTAYDAKKVEYSSDSNAAIYANKNSQVLFTEINPGNTVKGTLVFDVPKGTKLTSIELHDSLFSGGVTVDLR
ncbi:DUF4352 domain-containing protein [Actinoplanes sp. CA-030573]|uniref:DUF4352 domain-containing protein n=1 Tax=Actinoplanes sp. CA-030573 TaxID=3239898 RepID=UPI003D90ECF0